MRVKESKRERERDRDRDTERERECVREKTLCCYINSPITKISGALTVCSQRNR